MTPLLTTKPQELEWAVEMPDEIAEVVGVPKGSLVLLHAQQGKLTVEIMPAKPEMVAAAQRIYEKYKEDFEELKRIGD